MLKLAEAFHSLFTKFFTFVLIVTGNVAKSKPQGSASFWWSRNAVWYGSGSKLDVQLR
jgi:hypothetical protein